MPTLFNKNEARDNMLAAFSQYGAKAPTIVDYPPKMDFMQIHHTTIHVIVPNDHKDALVRALARIGEISNDLNKLAIQPQPDEGEPGHTLLNIYIGRPKPINE